MTFAHPAFLVAAAATLPAAFWLYRDSSRARNAAIALLGDPAVLARTGVVLDDRDRAFRWALRALALACLLVALARPQGEAQDIRAGRSGRDILVALDLSLSMGVQDADGTRLERARAVAREIANELPGDRFGLVIFGGAGFLQLPLTGDHAVFERFLDAVSNESIDDVGSDVAAALDVSRTVFAHEGGEGHRAIVVLSDGERSKGRLDEPIDQLVVAGIPVFAVGIGTERGGMVPPSRLIPSDSGARWHLDNIGRPVESRLDREALQRITSGTGGYFAMWDDPASLQELVSQVRKVAERPLGTQRVAQHVELFQWPLGAAVVFLVIETVLAAMSGQAVRRSGDRSAPRPSPLAPRQPLAPRPLPLALLLLLLSCNSESTAFRKATTLYHRSQYPEAFEAFASLASSKDPLVQLGAGNAAYRVSRYEDAAASYQRAMPLEGEASRAVRFNLGNAWYRAAQATPQREYEFYTNAIRAYEDALRHDPTDDDARFNLELALKRRSESESPGSPGRSGQAQPGAGDGNEEGLEAGQEQQVGAMAGGGSGDAAGESAEELSSDQARRMLEQVEREQLTEHEGRRGRRGERAERDW